MATKILPPNFFKDKTITLLRTDGTRKFFGCYDENGSEVVSTVQLLSEREQNAYRQQRETIHRRATEKAVEIVNEDFDILSTPEPEREELAIDEIWVPEPEAWYSATVVADNLRHRGVFLAKFTTADLRVLVPVATFRNIAQYTPEDFIDRGHEVQVGSVVQVRVRLTEDDRYAAVETYLAPNGAGEQA